jgi:hypothetical protein
LAGRVTSVIHVAVLTARGGVMVGKRCIGPALGLLGHDASWTNAGDVCVLIVAHDDGW